jgi:glycosyltransferase involved in cell wall biosynthesis
MKIAQCLEYPLFDPGGVEVLVMKLVTGLHSAGVETLLVTPRDLTMEQRRALPGVKEVFVWNRAVPATVESKRLADWLHDHQADLAHFHMGTYNWHARSWRDCPITHVARAGVPCVSTNHGAFSIFDCVAHFRPSWFKVLTLPIFWLGKLRQLTHVHWEATVSSHDLQAVRRWFFPVRKKFLQLYHSKLRGDEFSSPTSISDIQTPNNPFILCLGTIGARKGQQYLVEAFLKIAFEHPEWRLVLAGRQAHAPTMQLIKDQIAASDAGDRIIMMPDVDDLTARSLLQEAEIFAIPSTGEGLGLSLQEAMYAGCACIGSRVGGIPDLIEDGKTGLLVPPADVGALARALDSFLGDTSLRDGLGNAGRKSMQERGMTANQMTGTYLRLYKEVLRVP